MPKSKDLVINTGPLLAITAALGDLTVLQALYSRVKGLLLLLCEKQVRFK
jgi:hypothetical protein